VVLQHQRPLRLRQREHQRAEPLLQLRACDGVRRGLRNGAVRRDGAFARGAPLVGTAAQPQHVARDRREQAAHVAAVRRWPAQCREPRLLQHVVGAVCVARELPHEPAEPVGVREQRGEIGSRGHGAHNAAAPIRRRNPRRTRRSADVGPPAGRRARHTSGPIPTGGERWEDPMPGASNHMPIPERAARPCPSFPAARCVVAVVAVAAAPLAAQCGTLWQVGQGWPGTDQGVQVIAEWDPDGAGPAAPRLAVGGAFLFAGTERVNRVATFDPATGAWEPLLLGVDGAVFALAAMPNGDLFAGGSFGGAFGTICPGIVRWDGNAWHSVGGGVGLACYALLPLPNGDLIVAGTFTSAGGGPANHVARWNGSTWSPLGSGLGGPFPVARALARLPNGDVVVAGDFDSAGGLPVTGVARWDGSAWAAMPGLSAAARLAVLPSGDLIACTVGAGLGGSSLWRWTGSGWTPFAAIGGNYARATSLDVMPNGDLVVGGEFTSVAGVPATNLARWNGVAWTAVGTAANPPLPNTACTSAAGETFVGGAFTAIGSLVARSIARWDGAAWRALGAGPGGRVVAQAELLDGRHVVVTDDKRVLRRDGSAWTPLGPAFEDTIRDVAVLANGDLVIAGELDFVSGGQWHTELRRWDGVAWQPFATSLTAPGVGIPFVYALRALPDGTLAVGGRFTHAGGVPANHIAIWNGSAWQPLQLGVGSLGTSNSAYVNSIVRLANGDLVVGGPFFSAGGAPAQRVARWNGTAWSPLGSGIPGPSGFGSVYAVGVAGNGDVIAGGSFTMAGGVPAANVARWDGSAWAALGSGTDGFVFSLATLPNGDVLAGGEFTTAGGVASPRLARWNGAAWTAVAGGLGGASVAATSGVRTIALLRDGRLAVGGAFDTAGGTVSPNLAYAASTCPASVAASGSGCTGTGGALQLAVAALPWVGGTMRSVASGLTSGSLLVRVLGTAPASVPLAALHPAGGAGCTLLVAPLVLEAIAPPHAATVTTALAVPNAPALVGFVLHEQVAEIELDAAGAFTRINASNALTATVGSF
jgi:hypothetical protein